VCVCVCVRACVCVCVCVWCVVCVMCPRTTYQRGTARPPPERWPQGNIGPGALRMALYLLQGPRRKSREGMECHLRRQTSPDKSFLLHSAHIIFQIRNLDLLSLPPAPPSRPSLPHSVPPPSLSLALIYTHISMNICTPGAAEQG